MDFTTPAKLLAAARGRAGLAQRTLARRARTAQSVVARIESGSTSPSWRTLERLVRSAGFELRISLVPRVQGRSHMLEDVPQDQQDANTLIEMLKRRP